ncbi:MAG: PEP-CTERM sorting domain-containing protein [Pirellulaceae bacterium]|nr:PEP-CTERM sorting domain-containing protein [Pirellulaceae bacterium]
MRSKLVFVGFVLAVLLALPLVATAETIVTATFADGKGTSAAPVIDVVDAFTGMGGNGWEAGWTKLKGGSSSEDHAVLGEGDTGYVELVDANYLQYRFNTASGSTRHSCIYRDYADGGLINPAADHSIEFTIRIMENLTTNRFNGKDDRYDIHDRQFAGSSYTYASAESTWGISVVGNVKEWQIKSVNYDEQGVATDVSTGTGITISQNTPLSFKLDFNMSAGSNGTFDVTITSGETEMYSGTGFGLGKAPNGVGGPYERETTGRLLFTGFANNDSSEGTNYRNWDLDDIRITQIPEPTALAMILGLALAAVGVRRRK